MVVYIKPNSYFIHISVHNHISGLFKRKYGAMGFGDTFGGVFGKKEKDNLPNMLKGQLKDSKIEIKEDISTESKVIVETREEVESLNPVSIDDISRADIVDNLDITETADKVIRMHITTTSEVKRDFKTKCVQNGQNMSKVLTLMMKKYISMMIIFSFVVVKGSTTSDILKHVEQSGYPLNFKLSAQGQVGTDEKSTTGINRTSAGLLMSLDLYNQSAVDKKNSYNLDQKKLALNYLAVILGHKREINFIKKQKIDYNARKKVMVERVKIGVAEESTVYPIEQHLMNIESRLIEIDVKIKQSQLAVALLAGSKWRELFKVVKKWNYVL